MRQLIFALCIGALPFAANAVEPDEMLTDPLLEQRAREISKDLRCVVCQNQDIDSSNAGVARDLRLLVRERLVAGDTRGKLGRSAGARQCLCSATSAAVRKPWHHSGAKQPGAADTTVPGRGLTRPTPATSGMHRGSFPSIV